jgi:hypothetical protein
MRGKLAHVTVFIDTASRQIAFWVQAFQTSALMMRFSLPQALAVLKYVRQRDKREKFACLVSVISTTPYHPMKIRAIASEEQPTNIHSSPDLFGLN